METAALSFGRQIRMEDKGNVGREGLHLKKVEASPEDLDDLSVLVVPFGSVLVVPFADFVSPLEEPSALSTLTISKQVYIKRDGDVETTQFKSDGTQAQERELLKPRSEKYKSAVERFHLLDRLRAKPVAFRLRSLSRKPASYESTVRRFRLLDSLNRPRRETATMLNPMPVETLRQSFERMAKRAFKALTKGGRKRTSRSRLEAGPSSELIPEVESGISDYESVKSPRGLDQFSFGG